MKELDFIYGLDYNIMYFIQKNNLLVSNYLILNIIKIITFLGNGISYIILLPFIFLYFYKNNSNKEFLLLILVLLFSYILNESIKYIVHRVRPEEFFVIYMKGYSYPSGHAMNTTSFYLTFTYILSNKFNYTKIYYSSFVLIFMISLSRIILGVHWVSDVIIGIFLGLVVHLFFIHLYNVYWRN